MKKNKRTIDSNNLHYLKILGIVLAGILFYAILSKLDRIFSGIGFILDILTPITIGLCLAFVLNMPLKFFENKVFGRLTRKNGKVWKKIKRPLCITLSILIIIAILVLILSFIIPQLLETCAAFFLQLPEYMENLIATVNDLAARFHLHIELDSSIIDWQAISAWALDIVTSDSANNITESATELLFGLFNGIINFIIGFFLSLYILFSKESMGKLAKSILYAVMERDKARSVISVVTLSNRAFMGFISGQCVEVALIGVLCFVGMLILGMPHPLMVSCVIAVTAFIPIFGPVVGAIIGAFLILIVDPMKALWFLIFIIVLQQLESNIIYPRIMGKHVNLPGVWVLVAVTVGGGLFGVLGIIISIPLCSVFYTLFQQWLIKRLEKRNVCHVTMSHDSSEPNFIFIEKNDESPVGADDFLEIVIESDETPAKEASDVPDPEAAPTSDSVEHEVKSESGADHE